MTKKNGKSFNAIPALNKMRKKQGGSKNTQLKIKKIAIATPKTEYVLSDYHVSLTRMMLLMPPHGLLPALLDVRFANIEQSRWAAVHQARKINADYLLFIDSDTVFPQDLAAKLVGNNLDIVGCAMCRRRPPYTLNAEDLAERALQIGKHDTGVIEVSRVGTGVMLIKMDVFDKVPAPWFQSHFDPVSGKWAKSEDQHFCDMARLAGCKIYVDIDASRAVGHLGTHPYSIGDSTRWTDANGNKNRITVVK